MKDIIFRMFIVVFMIAIHFNIKAQLNVGGTPYSWNNDFIYKKEVKATSLPRPDLKTLADEDKKDEESGIPPRFGFLHSTNINLCSEDNVVYDTKEVAIYQVKLKCATALSINFLFDKFWLPEGSRLYVYNTNKNSMIGGFSSQNNKGDYKNIKGFGTGLVYGDEVILEYEEPKNVTKKAIINISGVVHGYRYINIPNQFNKTDGFGTSGSCNINVNCPLGANWQHEKRGVAMILVGGNRYCTGSLINNTSNDGDLLFLTAHHCLGGWANNPAKDAVSNPNATDWSFWWNYEAPTCSIPSSAPTGTITNGATVLANNAASDFALLQLSESPLATSPPVNVYFNGWDKSGIIPNSTTCIHHPDGDIKKISFDSEAPQISSYFGLSGSGTSHWRVVDWNEGTTEGGSSGSPLFNTNRQIVGQLHGGTAACGNDDSDWYGRFSVSWNDGQQATRRLRDWLDPINTGATSLNGGYWDGCLANVVVNQPIISFADIQASNSIVASSTIASGANVTFTAGSFIELLPGFVANSGSNFVAQIGPCIGRVIPPANKNDESESEELTSQTLDTYFNVYPNPNNGKFVVELNAGAEGEVNYKVLNISGQVLKSWFKNYNDQQSTKEQIELYGLSAGLYLISVEKEGVKHYQKIVIE